MKRGFTILECVIAAFVLVAGFLAVASVYPQSNREATLTRNHQTALALARSILEAISANYLVAPKSIYNSTLLNPSTVTEMVEGIPTTTQFTPSVSFVSGRTDSQGPDQNGALSPPLDVDTAVVTVQWQEGTSGAAKVKSLTLQGGVGSGP